MREAWSRGPRMTEQEALLRTTSNRRTTRLDLGIEAFTFPRVFYAAARVPRYVDDFEALWERFVRFPSSGTPRFKFGKGIRSGYVRPYVLYYPYDGAHDIVYVLRILHGNE